MYQSNSRDILIKNVGTNSNMKQISTSSYTSRSNGYNISASSNGNELSDGELSSTTTFCQQTLLDRRLGSLPETSTSESCSNSSSNGVRPRKLKINKGKDRIIPVQYVRRQNSNSSSIVTPDISKCDNSSKPIILPKIPTIGNTDSLNILQFLPIISSRN